ncbi:MAG: SpaA isopeptide-forming pilin-related protein [Suipraeoptans sp.]
MRKAKRIIALLLALLLLGTSDTSLYQVLAAEGEDALQDEVVDDGTTENDDLGEGQEEGQDEESGTDGDIIGQEANTFSTLESDLITTLDATEETKNFDMEVWIESEDSNKTYTVNSGGQFVYNIGFSVPVITDGTYTKSTITLQLPEWLSVIAKATSDGGINNLDVSGGAVSSVIYSERTRMLTINLSPTFTAGTGYTVSIGMQTNNFTTPDDTTVILEPNFTGEAVVVLSDGEDTSKKVNVIGTVSQDDLSTLKINSDDGWKVNKTATSTTTNGDEFTVQYKLEVLNTNENKDLTSTEREGRLDLESMILTDILPTGLPDGGGATGLSIRLEGSSSALIAGTDYVVNKSGDVITGFTLTDKMNLTTQPSINGAVPAGKPTNTTYIVQVTYPREPYLTESNAETLIEYTLLNNANIKYTLLGKNENGNSTQATTTYSGWETNPEKYNLIVKKYAVIDGDRYPLDYPLSTAKFTLYSDANCTIIATNYDKTVSAGSEQETNNNDTVTFRDLRYGTYYLKETGSISGLATPNSSWSIPVIISQTGVVTIGNTSYKASIENNIVVVVVVENEAESVGNVSFIKKGINSAGITGNLSGVTFTLTNKVAPYNDYTVLSDSNGNVSFIGIPVGNYTLSESGVGSNNPDFTVSSKTYDITVEAYKITKPVLDGDNTFLNESNKGTFSFTKIKEVTPLGQNEWLSGAKFKVFGPYATDAPISEAQVIMDNKYVAELSSVNNGLVQSQALTEGYYWVIETEAPTGYSIIAEEKVFCIQVVKQTNNNKVGGVEKTVKNRRLVNFTIKKKGVLGESSLYSEELAGAVIKIYNSEAEANNDSNAIGTLTTYLDSANSSTSNVVQLVPGTYWYKEISAPSGYSLPNPNTA